MWAGCCVTALSHWAITACIFRCDLQVLNCISTSGLLLRITFNFFFGCLTSVCLPYAGVCPRCHRHLPEFIYKMSFTCFGNLKTDIASNCFYFTCSTCFFTKSPKRPSVHILLWTRQLQNLYLDQKSLLPKTACPSLACGLLPPAAMRAPAHPQARFRGRRGITPHRKLTGNVPLQTNRETIS